MVIKQRKERGEGGKGAWGERTASPVLTRTPARGKQLGGCAVAAGPIPFDSLAVGNGPQGKKRGRKVGGGQSRGSSPPQEQHATAGRNHHHDGNCGILRAIRWVKINVVQLWEFLGTMKFKKFEEEDGRTGG